MMEEKSTLESSRLEGPEILAESIARLKAEFQKLHQSEEGSPLTAAEEHLFATLVRRSRTLEVNCYEAVYADRSAAPLGPLVSLLFVEEGADTETGDRPTEAVRKPEGLMDVDRVAEDLSDELKAYKLSELEQSLRVALFEVMIAIQGETDERCSPDAWLSGAFSEDFVEKTWLRFWEVKGEDIRRFSREEHIGFVPAIGGPALLDEDADGVELFGLVYLAWRECLANCVKGQRISGEVLRFLLFGTASEDFIGSRTIQLGGAIFVEHETPDCLKDGLGLDGESLDWRLSFFPRCFLVG